LDWDNEYFEDLYDGDPEPVFEDNPEGFYWTCCEVRGISRTRDVLWGDITRWIASGGSNLI
jgi:hypothetical protein